MKNLLPLTLCVSLLVAAPVIAQDSLSLQACIDLALKNNYAVKNSQLELTAALQTRRAAVTNYFPQIGAGGLQFHAEQPLMAFGSGSESMGLLEKGSVAYVGAVQPLFAGGRISELHLAFSWPDIRSASPLSFERKQTRQPRCGSGP